MVIISLILLMVRMMTLLITRSSQISLKSNIFKYHRDLISFLGEGFDEDEDFEISAQGNQINQ